MQCRTHPDKSAANTCNQCGDWLCDECTVDAQGRLFCRPCLTALAAPPSAPHTPPPLEYHGRRPISWGLLFLFSCFFPPGVNYMYMGLIKRGLAAMCGFFFIIYMIVTSNLLTVPFAFALVVFIFTCIFDGFHVRRRIKSGEAVRDGIGDVLSSILKNKTLSLAILIMLGITLFSSVFGFITGVISNILPLLVIGLGLYFLVSLAKRRGK